MKSFRVLFALLAPMLLFLGCSKEKSFEVGNETTSQWEFTEGSNNFHGKVDTAYKAELAPGVVALVVEGTSDDGSGLLTLGIIGVNLSAPGVYQSPNVLFDYTKASGTVYQNDINAAGQFTIEITKIDSAGVSGIFSGKAQDSSGTLKTITSGKFSARFAPSGSTGGGNAQVTFWSKAGCNGNGAIKVNFSNGQTANITSFTASEPGACGATGTATFTVPAGTYGYQAICGSDTTNGVVSVTAGQCLKKEVTFGTVTPTGQVSFWSKASCTTGGNIIVKLNNQTGTITSFTPAAPAACGISGNANFNLAAGSYTWVAKCSASTDSIVGTINVVANQCAKVEVIFPAGPAAQYSLVSSGGNCANFQVHGTYYATKPLFPDTNYVTVQVNVTTAGAYTISTNTVNGYSFASSGTFATTGTQTVTLKGVGTPAATGTNTFTATALSSTCSFAVPVLQLPAGTSTNTWSFVDGTKTYSGTWDGPGIFDDDFFGFGKSVSFYSNPLNSDTAFEIYVQFPQTATQPIPGTYVTDPNIFSSNTTYIDMYDVNTFNEFYYVKTTITSFPPPDVKITIVITSYDASTKILKGTFSGKAWNSAGQIVNITNGKFEGEVQF